MNQIEITGNIQEGVVGHRHPIPQPQRPASKRRNRIQRQRPTHQILHPTRHHQTTLHQRLPTTFPIPPDQPKTPSTVNKPDPDATPPDWAKPPDTVTSPTTHPYRPQTNGKAERFNQTLLKEWAYDQLYESNQQRLDSLPTWLRDYSWHRLRTEVDGPPASQLPSTTSV